MGQRSGVGSVVGEVRRDGSGRRTIVEPGGPIVTAVERAGNGVVAPVADAAAPSEVYVLPPGERAHAPVRLVYYASRLDYHLPLMQLR